MKKVGLLLAALLALALVTAACGTLPELPPTRTHVAEEEAVPAAQEAEATQAEAETDATPAETIEAPAPETAEPDKAAEPEAEPVTISMDIGAASRAVDLIGAWVDGGAPENDPFDYVGFDGNTYQGTFATDIQPLFTSKGVWFDGSRACDSCHFANSEASAHEMDLSTYAGIMSGGDVLSEPPGVPILGQSEFGATDYDWSHSKLRGRLRNNRMPPGWEFDITEGNRDGLCVAVSDAGVDVQFGEYGCELNAVGLIGAWVGAGAPETDAFEYGGAQLNYERDVAPFFNEDGMWFEGSQACAGCHFANSENSYHEMDLSTYAGIMSGGDVLSEPPGVPILGQSEIGATDYDWAHSKLRARLRNNRMPPGWEFDITEGNRDGPWVLHGEPVEVEAPTVAAVPAELGTPTAKTTVTTTTVIEPDGTTTVTSVTTIITFGERGGAAAGPSCAIHAVDLIGAWVDAGAPETAAFDYLAVDDEACSGTFDADILPLFTESNMWFDGSQACTGCHFANSENSYHEMDLS
ncbi:MAG: hypothetical protein ACE5E7_02625, partial [Anaerolineae bacterium]